MNKIKKVISVYFCVLVLVMQMPVSVFAEGENITEPVSVALLHQHTGNSTCEGGCYAADYHQHTDACYVTVWNPKSCDACHAGDHSGCSSCWYDPKLGWHCNCEKAGWYSSNLICGLGSVVVAYSLHCGMTSESVIGTLHINPSEQTSIVSSLNLNAYIDGTGATATNYLWNTGETSDVISVSSNGTYSCSVTYTDYNSSFTKDLSIIVKNIDNLAPEINMDLSTGWINKDLTVSINAQDAAESIESICSGLPVEAYSWDNGITWTSNNTYIYVSSGDYEVWVKDNAGNITKQNLSIQMDKMAPAVNINASCDWTAGNVIMTASATDDMNISVSGGDVSSGDIVNGNSSSGLAAEPFSWDGGATWTSNNTQEASDNGSYSVLARDNAGNISSATINIGCIDKSAPDVMIEKQFENWPYYEESMLITVNASDNQSGLHTEAYSFDGGSTWSNQNTYTVKNSFCLSIAVRDQVGNILYQNFDVVKEAAPVVSVQAVVKPVEPTPKEPDQQPEPEPEIKNPKIKPVEPEVIQEVQQIEIIEDETPTFAIPQLIATASTGATATGGMIFFVVFWIFNKCIILNGKNEKIGRAYIRKKQSVYNIAIPKKMNERYGSKLQIILKKRFVKANDGKPINVIANGVIHQKNVSEKITINT